MNEATLTLKNGQSHLVQAPVGRDLDDILHYMRVPADAAGRTLRLQTPTGAAIDVAAAEILSLNVPPPHALISDFMTDGELARVLVFAMTHASAFQDSGVHEAPDQAGYRIRSSRVLDGPGNAALAALVMPKLQALMPKLWQQLGMNPLRLATLECQITAHGDGDFFALHTDNGLPEIAHRLISYVYYFHREPKKFSGGHLCLFHTLYKDGYATCGQLGAKIDPPRNGVIIFPTWVYHEVAPIKCASSALTDQRLTLNGWLF